MRKEKKTQKKIQCMFGTLLAINVKQQWSAKRDDAIALRNVNIVVLKLMLTKCDCFFLLYMTQTALAHYHAAISIDINNTKSHENSKRDEFQLNNNNSFALSDLTNDTDVNPCALKKAHIKESVACYEEAMRLQRMSRDLKVIFFQKLISTIKIIMRSIL